MLERTIDNESCRETGPLSVRDKIIDRERSSFILRKKLRSVSGRKRLGLAWIVIDPIVTSLIYLFVLTVLRARTDPESLFIGIVTYQVLTNSIKSGSASVKDLTGGFKAERIRTRTMLFSTIRYRIIDTFSSTAGVMAILYFIYGVPLVGVMAFLIVAQLVGLLFEGVGLSFSMTMKRIPDLYNVMTLFLRLMFFAGPVMYPMSMTEGLHYRVNLYNPFTYFVEASRYISDLETTLLEFGAFPGLLVIAVVAILAYRGYSKIDSYRWRMTTWA